MLNRLSAWWARPIAAPVHADSLATNVVQLRGESANDRPSQSAGLAEPPLSTHENSSAKIVGLMDEREIGEFFEENWFGLGRHNGAVYRTREALDRGRAAVAARFQNAAQRLAERREVQLRRLQDSLTEIEGISETTSRRLQQAIGSLKQDQDKLQAQVVEASRYEGWVKDAVLKYEAGFAKGLYEAVAIELHGGAK